MTRTMVGAATRVDRIWTRSIRWSTAVFEPVGVFAHIDLPLIGKILFGKNGLDWTLVHTQAAVNAGVRIDKELIRTAVSIVRRAGMDAVHRANINTSGVFGSYTGFSNNVCHSISNFGKNLPQN